MHVKSCRQGERACTRRMRKRETRAVVATVGQQAGGRAQAPCTSMQVARFGLRARVRSRPIPEREGQAMGAERRRGSADRLVSRAGAGRRTTRSVSPAASGKFAATSNAAFSSTAVSRRRHADSRRPAARRCGRRPVPSGSRRLQADPTAQPEPACVFDQSSVADCSRYRRASPNCLASGMAPI